MSQVVAYRCDYCLTIKTEANMVGIVPTEDMFNKLDSYPSVHKHVERAQVHHCLGCYKSHVLNPAEIEIDKRKNKEKYLALVKALYYNLRSLCVKNWQNKYYGKDLDDC